MLEDDDSHPPLLACGHVWDGAEAWPDMFLVLKEDLDGAPAYSTGHSCRRCRQRIDPAQRLGSLAEADEWLRAALAARETQRLH